MESAYVKSVANTPTTESASAVVSGGSGGGKKQNSVKVLRRQFSNPATLDIRYTAAEIRSILFDELPSLPVEVNEWIVRTVIDSTEKPAIWVWAVLPDENTDIDIRLTIRDIVFDFLRIRCHFLGWVYVSFKTIDEMDKLS